MVPVTNPLAYAMRRRTGDRNLNRKLAPTETPREYEDHVANWLCPLLAQHEVLLDLHSFRSPGAPFVMLGPENNRGALEPFAHAAREEALALRLGVQRAVDGWLGTYAAGAARRAEFGRSTGVELDTDPRYGIGTTEYMRSVGGWSLTLECGQHDDPAAPDVAYRAIVNTLAHLKLIDAPDPAPARTHGRPAPVRRGAAAARRRCLRARMDQLRSGGGGPADRAPPRRHRGARAARRLRGVSQHRGRRR